MEGRLWKFESNCKQLLVRNSPISIAMKRLDGDKPEGKEGKSKEGKEVKVPICRWLLETGACKQNASGNADSVTYPGEQNYLGLGRTT